MSFYPFGQSKEGGHIGLQFRQPLLLVHQSTPIPGHNFSSLKVPIARACLRKVEQIRLQLFGEDADIVLLI